MLQASDYTAGMLFAAVKVSSEGMDAVYEDFIETLIGCWGISLLRTKGYLEPCGVVNGRQLYALVDLRGPMWPKENPYLTKR